MGLLLLILIVGFIAYFAMQFILAMIAIIGAVFFCILLAPLVISSQTSGVAAICGLIAMGMAIWFLSAVLNPSTPKYTDGKRSTNPFD